MNILIIGGGGREHALAWKMSQSDKLTKLFIASGNAGTATHGTNVNIAIEVQDKRVDVLIGIKHYILMLLNHY